MERTYKEAALDARALIRDGGDSEDLRLAVGEAVKSAPSEEDRKFWESIAAKLADGLEVRSKELDS